MGGVTAARIDVAFDRVDAFLAVQGHAPTVDAVKLLQEAVGVDADARAVIAARLAALADAGQQPAVGSLLLGVLIGLFAADGAR